MAGLQKADRVRQSQMAETLRVMGDIRREMGDMQAELLALLLTTRPACRPSLVSCLLLLEESLLSVTVAHGQSLRVLLSLSVVPESGSHVTDDVSGSVYSATVAVFGVSQAGTPVHTLAHGGSEAHGPALILESCCEVECRCWEVVDSVLVLSQVINMPRAIIGDTSRSKSYIPKVSEIPGFSPILAQFYKPIENRCIHDGRVVDQLYYKSNGIERLFTNVRFNCLFEINKPIVPRLILDFYSQVKVQTNEYGGHRDHLSASLAHMMYCIVGEEQYNLDYSFVKRIECARATLNANLPYGMFMRPLALKQTRKARSDRGKPKARNTVSSSSGHHLGSSSRHEEDDEDEGTSRAST
nr:ribosomal protein L7Ae/L30e/S12e/Gadd45 [Tanacetum cinerariifolium]